MAPLDVWHALAQSKATDILQEYRSTYPLTAPVPVFEVVEAYLNDVQIEVRMDHDFPDGVSAFTTRDPRTGWLIVVNGREPVVRQRFSVGHELGHITLIPNQPKKVFCSHNNRNWMERVCDGFAGNLLMPKALVLDAYRAETSVPNLADIAQTFKVSRVVAEIQLKRLGLPFMGTA